jgi:Domain of unknown function (DUF1905)
VLRRRPRRAGLIGPFTTTLCRYPGKGGWHFAIVPTSVAPPVTRPWGRTPVRATVDGATWETSVWRDSKGDRSLLAVPKAHRGGKGHGDPVTVTLEVLDDE